MAPYRLVAVEWEDSEQPVSEWPWIDDYDAPHVVECVSVGYLIAETEKAVALAPNLGDMTRERVQASGIIRIPRGCIQKMRDLR